MITKQCLIADDSPVVRKLARRILEDLDLEIDDVQDGRAALDRCEVSMPDVVLLDWNMPVMNGLEFLRALRKMDGGTEPRVIFCTTESDVDHIRDAMAAGADDYITKPFDAEILLEKMSMA